MSKNLMVALIATLSLATQVTLAEPGHPGPNGGGPAPSGDHDQQGPRPSNPQGPSHRAPDGGNRHDHDSCNSSCQDANAAGAVIALGAIAVMVSENNAASTQAKQQELQSEADNFASAYEQSVQSQGATALPDIASYPTLQQAALAANVDTTSPPALYNFAITFAPN